MCTNKELNYMDKIVTHACPVGQTLTRGGLALLPVWPTRLHTPRGKCRPDPQKKKKKSGSVHCTRYTDTLPVAI